MNNTKENLESQKFILNLIKSKKAIYFNRKLELIMYNSDFIDSEEYKNTPFSWDWRYTYKKTPKSIGTGATLT